MSGAFVILWLLIGLLPDEANQKHFHPAPDGSDSSSLRSNFWRAGDFGGCMKEIPLTNSPLLVLVDDVDFELLNEMSWHITNTGYARRSEWFNGQRWKILMHRVVMNAPADLEVDHINHNGLDNRKENLRLATRRQNSWNCFAQKNKLYCPAKGVSFQKGVYRKKPWVASIRIMGKPTHLGHFSTPEEAAEAYEIAAIQNFGEFALT